MISKEALRRKVAETVKQDQWNFATWNVDE